VASKATADVPSYAESRGRTPTRKRRQVKVGVPHLCGSVCPPKEKAGYALGVSGFGNSIRKLRD
jgi:hypothetical protein